MIGESTATARKRRMLLATILSFILLVSLSMSSSMQGPSSIEAPYVRHTNRNTLGGNGSIRTQQVLPSGQRPFLVARPFNETYGAPINLNCFFDHRLPKYEDETNPNIPTDLRDANRSITSIFTGEERPTNPGQGYGWYSGHNGLDYGLMANVLAPADGRIATGRETSHCQIWIEHDASLPPDNAADYATLYTHLSNIGDAPEEEQKRPGRDPNCGTKWCKGDSIRAGDIVGIAGNDPCGGTSDGIHLHFGMVAGSLTGGKNPSVLDPFGWWSNAQDPWADNRLGEPPLTYSPQESYWLWAAPHNPGQGNPGYWGEDIASQTDDTDASFHRFGPLGRESLWKPVETDQSSGIEPIGTGAWWSKSISEETGSQKKNWAVWGLHVPDTGEYRIQAHIPKMPQIQPNPVSATSAAKYTVRVPLTNGSIETWNTEPVNQRVDNQWLDLNKDDGTSIFEFQGGTVVLVELSDLTGTDGEAVLFDALRLRRESPPGPPPSPDWRRVGFVIDNTSSMQAEGKIGAVKSAIPPWIDQLEASEVSYMYALEAFAENVPPVQVTEIAAEMKAWIGALTANDNGLPNYDCPEESLAAITQLAPTTQGGNILFFTDDLPKSPDSGKVEALVALENAQAKLHSIILPKTCWIGGGGDPSGWEVYQFLSLTTGGTYQTVSTDKTSDALQIVLSEMQADNQLGSSSSNTAQATRDGVVRVSGTEVYDVIVDETISQVNFLLNILEGSFSLSIFRPDGTAVSPTDPDVTFTDSGSAQYYQITSPSSGTWQAQVTGTGDYIFSTSADSTIQFAYLGDVQASPGIVMQLAARVSGPIATANFEIEKTDGQSLGDVEMFDDGTRGDFSSGDGVYTGWYTPTITGDFRMRITGTTESGTPFSRVDSRLIRVRNLSVIAPTSGIVPPGTTHTFTFTVRNAGDSTEVYDLEASSGNGWILQGPVSSIAVDGGGSVVVPIIVAVPIDAASNTIDVVRLSAVSQDDGTIIVEGTTTVIVPDLDERFDHFVYLPVVRRGVR